MPRYDWRCSECDLVFEVVRRFEDAALPTECPTCHAAAERVWDFSGVHVLASGSGQGKDLLTQSCNKYTTAARALGIKTASPDKMRRDYGKMMESRAKGARAGKASRHPIRMAASIPEHVFHDDPTRYRGKDGLDQAKKDGFGL